MNEHPILMNPEMVNAVLAGRKTQTRRVIQFKRWKEAPVVKMTEHFEPYTDSPKNYQCWTADHQAGEKYTLAEQGIMCPFGFIGDTLWVRESWQYSGWTEDGEPWIRYAADGEQILYSENIPLEWGEKLTDIWADLSTEENCAIDGHAADRKWRPSIFLPRWASRIDLKITNIRVQRVQDILPIDSISEGVYVPKLNYGPAEGPYAIATFANVWDKLNLSRGYGWEKNPWVWVIDFERVKS